MDIKEHIDNAVNQIKNDKNLAEEFKTDPVKTLEKILNVDLPDEQVKGLIEGIGAKLNLDNAGGEVKGVLDGAKNFVENLLHHNKDEDKDESK